MSSRSQEYNCELQLCNIPQREVESVSIVICTRNRATAFRDTLASVAGLQVPDGVTTELLVVDNGSNDGTADLVRSTSLPNVEIRLVTEPVPGLSKARNTGLAEAKGNIILFTDDDVRLPSDWIGSMIRPILEGSADAVAGKVVLDRSLHRNWMQPMHRIALASTEFLNETDPGAMFGASMGFHRRVLDRVPGFDPELGAGALGAGEETLFAWMLREAGYRIGAAFHAPVTHVPGEERLRRDAFLDAARRIGRSLTYIDYHWRHLPRSAWQHAGIPAVRLTLLVYRMRLGMLRALRRREIRRAEGIAPWEYTWVRRISRIKYYLQIAGTPRKYDRHGMRKQVESAER